MLPGNDGDEALGSGAGEALETEAGQRGGSTSLPAGKGGCGSRGQIVVTPGRPGRRRHHSGRQEGLCGTRPAVAAPCGGALWLTRCDHRGAGREAQALLFLATACESAILSKQFNQNWGLTDMLSEMKSGLGGAWHGRSTGGGGVAAAEDPSTHSGSCRGARPRAVGPLSARSLDQHLGCPSGAGSQRGGLATNAQKADQSTESS